MSNKELRAVFPNDKEMRYIVSEESVYEKYVDALSLIHDKVVEFTVEHEPARLSPHERDTKFRLLIQKSEIVPVRENIQQNWAIAKQVRRNAEASETAAEVRAAEEQATMFLKSLIDIYSRTRFLKQYHLSKHL